MKDFIYDGPVRVVYGPGQMEMVTEKIVKLGKKILVVPDASFMQAGHYGVLVSMLEEKGGKTICLENVQAPVLSKVMEGIALCREHQVDVVVGVGGGVCMDIAKSVSFGTRNDEKNMEQYLTYQLPTEGLPHLPVITIPTNPMSGSETNADVQITLDESGLQVGCPFARAEFTWLNPQYVMSLPSKVLAYGQMTAFAQLSCNYLNLTRGTLAEHISEATMKTILSCLRRSIAEPEDMDARGNLMICSAISLSGINDFGREFDFVPYPLQSFAQRYLGLKYPQAMTGLFPYWMKAIYREAEDKSIFKRYFDKVLGIHTEGKEEEALLQEALSAIIRIYKEFRIASHYGELVSNPKDHERLVGIIDSFGPMQSQFMEITSERLAGIIEDAITGNLD